MGTMVLRDNDQLRRASQSQPHSREQPDTKAGDDAPNNHDPESRGESLNGTTNSKDNGADEERASSANDVADTTCCNRGDWKEQPMLSTAVAPLGTTTQTH